MKGSLRILMGLAVVALAAAIVAPAALAQCPQARVFGGQGGGMAEPKINVLSNGAENLGNEVGYFWENGNPGNDSVGGGGVGCPSSLWYVSAGPDRRIDGAVATPVCQMDVCPGPGATLNLIVEDNGPGGSGAYMVMFQVDETPPAFRWWDHARVTPGYTPGAGGTHSVNLEPYPTVDVTGSAGPPPGTTTTNNYANLSLNYNGVSGPAHTPNPATTGIAFYDILGHHGPAAPLTNDRSSYNLGVVKQVPFNNAAVSGDSLPVPCPNASNNTWVAVGVEFVDGVKSAKSGDPVAVSCDPNVADPDDSKNKLRPKTRGKKKPLGRSGR